MNHPISRTILLTIAILSSHLALHAQTSGRIAGFVKAADTGEPLSFANPILAKTS